MSLKLLIVLLAIAGLNSGKKVKKEENHALKQCLEKVILAEIFDNNPCMEDTITGVTAVGNHAIKNEVNMLSLLNNMKVALNATQCSCDDRKEDTKDINKNLVLGLKSCDLQKICSKKDCARKMLYDLSTRFLKDFDSNGRVDCDDVATLLYMVATGQKPDHIECTQFWAGYKRNIAFLKHSTDQIDANREEILTPKKQDLFKSINITSLESDIFICNSGQCGANRGLMGQNITRCDGKVQCADLSDELDCEEKCPTNAMDCLVDDKTVCLVQSDICKYSPAKCLDADKEEFPLAKHCAEDLGDITKLEKCEKAMDKTYREVFGEWKDGGPKTSYRADICSWNQVSITDNMGISRLEKKTVMGIYHKFKSLNVEMSQCQNQVDQSLEACLQSCSREPSQGEEQEEDWFQCNSGRCLNLDEKCNGVVNCPDGDDETVDACDDVEYQAEDIYFPCPSTGQYIHQDLVCNGVADCEDGEDEDSATWESNDKNYKYFTNTSEWRLRNNNTKNKACFTHKSGMDLTLYILLVILIIIYVVIMMEPIETNEIKQLVVRNKNKIDKLVEEIVFHHSMDKTMRYKDLDKKMTDIKNQVIASIDGEVSAKKLSIELTKLDSGGAIQNYLSSSVGRKLRQKVFKKFSVENERRIHNLGAIKTVLLTGLNIIFMVFEYIIDYSLLVAYYKAWSSFPDNIFSLKVYYLKIFVATLVLLITHQLSATIFSWHWLPLSSLKQPGKASTLCYIMSRILAPIYFPLLYLLYSLKKIMQPATDFDKFQEDLMVKKEYERHLLNLSVIKMCTENFPQLLIAVFLYLSDPLHDSVVQSDSRIFINLKEMAVLFFAKSMCSFLLKSWKMAKLDNSKIKTAASTIGQFFLASSYLFFGVSRIMAVLFCTLYSSLFPDLTYYLFFLSLQPSQKQVEIPNTAREALYQMFVINSPMHLCFAFLFLAPFVNMLAVRLFFRKITQNKENFMTTLPVALINIIFPFSVLSSNFQKRRDKLFQFNNINFSIFFLLNAAICLLPFLFYDKLFFKHYLPIVNELLIFYGHIHTNLPKSIPTQLPVHFLHGHLLFPIASLTSFILGLLIFQVYKYMFHPWSDQSEAVVEECKKIKIKLTKNDMENLILQEGDQS